MPTPLDFICTAKQSDILTFADVYSFSADYPLQDEFMALIEQRQIALLKSNISINFFKLFIYTESFQFGPNVNGITVSLDIAGVTKYVSRICFQLRTALIQSHLP